MNIEQVKSMLKKKGIHLEEIAVNPIVYEKACHIVYNAIPIPFRWFIGKNKINNFLQKIRDQIKTVDLSNVRKTTSGSQIKTVGVVKAGSTASRRM